VRSPPDRLVALLERPSGDASDDQLAGDVAARRSSREPAPVMSGHLLRGGRIDDDAYVGRDVGDRGERGFEPRLRRAFPSAGLDELRAG